MPRYRMVPVVEDPTQPTRKPRFRMEPVVKTDARLLIPQLPQEPLEAVQAAHQPPPLVVILRGAPGAGKSTWAQHYRTRWGFEVQIVSASDYFLTDDGHYRFDANHLKDSHAYCAAAFGAALRAKFPRILLDNTNILPEHYRDYVQRARAKGYCVYQRVLTGTYHNINGVPEDEVLRMRQTFQKDTTLTHYEDD
jgi:AAA domain